ncbi:MAG TPA: hypothetical protein VM123_15960 [archaeon]|nr:hypothetical protein [archaeon]
MKRIVFILAVPLLVLTACGQSRSGSGPGTISLTAQQAALGRPEYFPRRIWAACDFELLRKDVVWTGELEHDNIPAYPGNSTALRARPAGPGGLRFLSVKPVSYPRMGGKNQVYFRYFIRGASSLTLEIFNLDRNDSHRVRVSGLRQGAWSETTLDFSAAQASGPVRGLIVQGERMNDLIFNVEPAREGIDCELVVDDVVCFSDDPEPQKVNEPFPRRVICVWDFDVLDYYHPWTHDHYQVLRQGEPLENDWGVCRAVANPENPDKRIRLVIDPPQAVGESTKLRFRYFLVSSAGLQVQIFDLTDLDNRHIVLPETGQGAWHWSILDFTRDGIKNNGLQTPFEAGNLVDDIFFLPRQAPGKEAELLIDEVVLYDAYSD